MIELLELYWKNNFMVGVVLLGTVLCMQFEKKKYSVWKSILFIILLFTVSSAAMQVWNWEEQKIVLSNILYNVPVRILICALTVFQIYMCNEISLWNSLFLMTIVVIIQKAQFNIYKMLENIFIGPVTFSTPGVRSIMLALSILLIVTLIVWWITREKAGLIVRMDSKNKNVVMLSIVLIIIDDMLNMYLFTKDPYANYGSTSICMRIFDTLFLGVTLYMLYNLISRKNLELEQVTQQLLENQRMAQYSFSKEIFEIINIKSHDLKKQMRYLQNDNEEQAQLLKELKKTLDDFDMTVDTNNYALSTILSEKYGVCHQKKIPFSYIGSGENMNFMRGLDIYTLFANLMDNAIEASEKVAEEKRYIQLVIKTQKDFLSIHMENTFSGEIQYKNGNFMTIKKDRDYHGFGVTSMNRIVEKYSGNMMMKVDNFLFVVNILIPIPEQGSDKNR